MWSIADRLSNAKASIYRHVLTRIPLYARTRLAQSPLLRPVRDWFFRPGGQPALRRVDIFFEGCRFRFVAPLQVAHVAETHGIENTICKLIVDTCEPGDVCIDVGANYGYLSLVMSRRVEPSGRVFAIEANPQVFETLRANLTASGCPGLAEAVHAFAGDTPPQLTIDRLVADRRLSRLALLKIDVDGPELSVLRGARETLRALRPLVVVELNRDQDAICDLLAEQGYLIADMKGDPVDRHSWPPNVFAGHGFYPRLRSRPS